MANDGEISMPLRFRFLGKPCIEDESGCNIKLPTKRGYWILAYLWLHRDQAHDRLQLANIFWPEKGNEKRLRQSLREELSKLNKAFEPYEESDKPHLLTTAGSVQFNADCDVWVDTRQFRELIEVSKSQKGQTAIESLERALKFYGGDFLDGHYEEWKYEFERKFRELKFEALESLINLHQANRDFDRAIERAEELYAEQSHRQSYLRHLLYLIYADGRPNDALKRYQQAEIELPDGETEELVGKIEARVDPNELRSYLQTADVTDPAKIFEHSSTFIGRVREIDEVVKLLDTHRLVTVKGTGGAGKSSLAREVGKTLNEKLEHGARWISLKELADSTFLIQQIARELGIKEQSNRPLIDSVLDYLAPKEILLILDNCEHVIKPCAEIIQQLLRHAPVLRILTTSRESFGVPGEKGWPIPALSLPDEDDDDPSPENLLNYDAIRLFVERARERPRSSAFNLTSKNAKHVISICRQQDGMPLPIELAAKQVESFTVEEIDKQLRDILGFSVDRAKILEATIDWSYNLLAEAEKELFIRLAVFGGSFNLCAVKAICSDEKLNKSCLMHALPALVEKSLVVFESCKSSGRYHQLETIKEYGLAKLAESCDRKRWFDRYLDFYLALAEEAEPELTKGNQQSWLDGLEREHDNFRAVLDYSMNEEKIELGLKLAGALWLFWYIRGYWKEGRYWLESLLEEASSVEDRSIVAKGLYAAAAIAHNQGDLDVAESFATRSLEIAEELENQSFQAEALNIMGTILTRAGKYEEANESYDRALKIFRSLDDDVGVGAALISKGFMHFTAGKFEKTIEVSLRALDIYKPRNDLVRIGKCLCNIGSSYLNLCDYHSATRYYDEAMPVADAIGDPNTKAEVMDSLGASKKSIALNQNPALVCCPFGSEVGLYEAIALHTEAFSLHQKLGSRNNQARSLRNLGLAHFCSGDLRQAEDCLTASLEISQPANIDFLTVSSLSILARTFYHHGKHQESLKLSQQAIELLNRKFENRWEEVKATS